MKKESLISQFFNLEASSSILLGICLMFAVVLANNSFTADTYFSLIEFHIGTMSLQHWVNDGLMAIFFYLVGMEIKREMISGSLSSIKKSMLPLFGAVGGMLVPALIFSIINKEPGAANAWGIPMATDIAFAVGVLVVVGSRAPIQLRALLLALAVIDDLGAILVIALFYSKGVNALYILGFVVCALIAWGANQKKYNIYIHHFLGLVGWALILSSGIHATLAGVIWGFLTPGGKTENAPLDKAIHWLHPYINFGVLPLFALVNSGIRLPSIENLPLLASSSLLWAVTLGLFFGKPIGIIISCWICVKAKMAELPKGINWSHISSLGLISGIGFTMSLFIAQLSIGDNETLANSAKIGIVAGSILSGLAGAGLLLVAKKPREALSAG
jgi:Na+:H+ antiporter, NhaA family